MTEKYSTKNYKPGHSPARLQRDYKMTYENAYNLAQDLNNIFNRLYMVEQEKKEYRKETERLREALEEIKNQVEQAQDTVYPFHLALDSKDGMYILELAKKALKRNEE